MDHECHFAYSRNQDLSFFLKKMVDVHIIGTVVCTVLGP
jgi:hypothetical protein